MPCMGPQSANPWGAGDGLAAQASGAPRTSQTRAGMSCRGAGLGSRSHDLESPMPFPPCPAEEPVPFEVHLPSSVLTGHSRSQALWPAPGTLPGCRTLPTAGECGLLNWTDPPPGVGEGAPKQLHDRPQHRAQPPGGQQWPLRPLLSSPNTVT